MEARPPASRMPRLDRSFFLSAQGLPYLLTPLIPAAVVMELVGSPAGAIFVVSALGIIPTAALMGRATEELASRSGPGIGGLLNVTFGNAPELIIALFALGAGLHEVVKASIIGSIIGNILLVLGASMFFGGLKHTEQKFEPRGASVQTSMLLLAAAAMVMPAIFELVEGEGLPAPGRGDRPLRRHRREPLAGGRADPDRHLRRRAVLLAEDPPRLFNPDYGEEETWGWSVRTSVAMLAIAGVLVGLMSEILVGSISEASRVGRALASSSSA